ncbi:hypothetical protein ALC57_16476, partial [Trachymyrmex cornetzi]
VHMSTLLLRKKTKKWLNRRWLVRPFYRYTRMRLENFEKLVELTKPYLIKKSHRALLPEL